MIPPFLLPDTVHHRQTDPVACRLYAGVASSVNLRDARGSISTITSEAMHVAECLGDEPAIGLHVYGGDILSTTRHMWDPETLEVHPLAWILYERLAQKASKAASAP